MKPELVKISKFVSLVLRHRPEIIGLELDPSGWALVEDLLLLAREKGVPVSRAELDEVVATNDKKRFIFSPDGKRIRANQGHSVAVDLGLKPLKPPAILYHGTARAFLDSIKKAGLLSGKRQHVHLSQDRQTALKVGSRHGVPALILVQSGKMWEENLPFYRSENKVWLTETVPSRFLDFSES